MKICFLLLMFVAFTGCSSNADYYRDQYYYEQQYYKEQYYGEPYYSLMSALNHYSINNLEDIADMVYMAWNYGVEVEVDIIDYYGFHLENDFISNDHLLKKFLDEIYHNEISILDVEVLEEGLAVFLNFTVETQQKNQYSQDDIGFLNLNHLVLCKV